MRAATVAIGSELLSTDRLDTNSLRLAAAFEAHGVELVRKVIVGDDEPAIAAELVRSVDDADLVVVTGGLGPTEDDLTREAVARAFGLGLHEDAEVVAAIERRFASFGRVPSPNNRRQAQIVDGGAALSNPRGTAPGQRIEVRGRTIFLLPGVPFELEHFLERDLVPWLAARAGSRRVARRVLLVALRPESEVDQSLAPLYAEFGREAVTVLASPGEVRIVLVASGDEREIGTRLERLAQRARELLGDAIYGEGEATTLESTVGALLADRGLSIAVAESCTGGLVSARITAVPGSSRYFPGGVVTYANEQKEARLGVPRELLETHGAVSEPVARAMADGVRRSFVASLGVAVTGVAGPDGGSAEKPVGTVHIAVAAGDGNQAGSLHRRFRFPGDRERIRRQASQAALELVRRSLLGLGGGAP